MIVADGMIKMGVIVDYYFVARRFEGDRSNEGIISFHWNITWILFHMGLLKGIPYLLTVISEN